MAAHIVPASQSQGPGGRFPDPLLDPHGAALAVGPALIAAIGREPGDLADELNAVLGGKMFTAGMVEIWAAGAVEVPGLAQILVLIRRAGASALDVLDRVPLS